MSLSKSAYLGEAVMTGGSALEADPPFTRSLQRRRVFSTFAKSSRRADPANRRSVIALVLEAAAPAHDLSNPSEKPGLKIVLEAKISLSAAPPHSEHLARFLRQTTDNAACSCSISKLLCLRSSRWQ